MGKEADREQYLRNCATTIRGQLGLSADKFKDCKTFADIQAKLFQTRWAAIDDRLQAAPDDQIGKLACCKDAALVRNLATDAVIPAIAQKVWAELNPKRVLKCKFCDFTVAKFARHRPNNGFEAMRDHLTEAHPDKAEEIARAIFGNLDAQWEEHDENPDFF